jgi:sugar phosphate permease
MIKRSRFFYGWVVVGISLMSTLLIYGMRHSFSVFFPYILDEFGWNRGSTAIMLSLSILIYGLSALVAGRLGDRWKPRKVMPIGLIVLGLATVGCGFANRLSHFYLFFGILMPIGSAFCGWPLLAPAITNWFVKKRGLALGLGSMGGGLSFIYGMFAEFAISSLGWRYAYFVLAGILIALMLPLYPFFHYRPEDRGMKPYGAAEPLSPKESFSREVLNVKDDAHRDWTLRRAFKTSQLWLMVFSLFLYWGIGVYMVLAHQSNSREIWDIVVC